MPGRRQIWDLKSGQVQTHMTDISFLQDLDDRFLAVKSALDSTVETLRKMREEA